MKNGQNDVKRVFNYIQDKLISGHYSYGTRITPELVIKKELNVSRAVVREGITTFSSLGILERIQGDGTYPTNKNTDEYIKELLEIKEAFDLFLIHTGVKKNKKRVFNMLEERLEKIKKEEIDDYEIISYYDKEISKLSENGIMIKFYEYIYKFVDKILRKDFMKQTKEEIFENYKNKYSEIRKNIE